jgi:hypothetical protein
MLFGMTRNEIALVAFIFALVYVAQFLSGWGERIGVILFGPRK